MGKDKHCKKEKKKVICCDPVYIIEDSYTEKEVTFVHPIIRVKREHIKYVRRDVYKEKVIKEVIDPGAPTKCDCNKKHKKCKKKSKKK
ncbi:hypothetical protein ABE65_011070 [Fictibacillus phosphorivorans]|uniref:Uncharacterized protein n=1 Tax=Fictibacillus phosphorivorans TaxID=1221500 RepID=A0A160IMD5_9BACL|nr:hypothetical protein [Fictibacillus phosphorivorans]ANC77314.1 hypothetical protein ABE65_011070 [Fictibacillus phosphorivorans]